MWLSSTPPERPSARWATPSPLSRQALRRAIELNGEAVAMNLAAFEHGRLRAHTPAPPPAAQAPSAPESLETLVERFSTELAAYQNAAYAKRYRDRVARIAQAERAVSHEGASPLAEAVARGLFKLMAMKDEYEVARLYANGDFARQAREAFEGDLRFTFHLAPPLLAPRDKRTGLPGKIAYGGWMMHAFRLLAPLKRLRFTPLDIFGATEERRAERALLARYEMTLDEIATRLTPANYQTCVALAALPEKVRGFGHVRARHMAVAEAEQKVLLASLEARAAAHDIAAE
jgi:indolepyruvate ferredoxin oxidoreductase